MFVHRHFHVIETTVIGSAPGSQRIHLDTGHSVWHVILDMEAFLNAGCKMRVRYPNYCETSGCPISAPNFTLSSNKRNKWRIMMLWFGK